MKLYYICPIEASYMAKNFGVKLTINDGCEVFNLGVGMATEGIPFVYHTPPYYIHPDSLSIFEPQEGDKGQDEAGNQCFYTDEWYCSNPNYGAPVGNVFIDYRSKPFIMPQQDKGGK